MAVHCSGTHFTVQIVGGCRDFIVIFLGLRNPGLRCWDCSFRFSRLEGFLGLGGFRLIAEIWRSVFLISSLFCVLHSVWWWWLQKCWELWTWWRRARTLLLSRHVTRRRVVGFSKLGLLMLSRLYKLLILCTFVTLTFLHICREHLALCCCIWFFSASGWLLVTMTNQGRWLSIECCFDIRSGDIRSHSASVAE